MSSTAIFIQMTPEQLEHLIDKKIAEANKKKSDTELQKPKLNFLSKNEVRDILKVSNTTLWNWDKKGILKSFKVEKKVYYDKDEVDSLKFNKNS